LNIFPLQEARHQNEEMKKKKEQEERKARAMAEVKNNFSFLSFIPCRLKSITAMLPYETFSSRPTQLFSKPPLKKPTITRANPSLG